MTLYTILKQNPDKVNTIKTASFYSTQYENGSMIRQTVFKEHHDIVHITQTAPRYFTQYSKQHDIVNSNQIVP